RRVFSFESDRVDSAPELCGFIKHINHFHREQLVWHGEIEADEVHSFRSFDRRAEIVGMNLESEIAPIQAKLCNSRILHRRRGGMFDRMTIHCAKAGGRVY